MMKMNFLKIMSFTFILVEVSSQQLVNTISSPIAKRQAIPDLNFLAQTIDGVGGSAATSPAAVASQNREVLGNEDANFDDDENDDNDDVNFIHDDSIYTFRLNGGNNVNDVGDDDSVGYSVNRFNTAKFNSNDDDVENRQFLLNKQNGDMNEIAAAVEREKLMGVKKFWKILRKTLFDEGGVGRRETANVYDVSSKRSALLSARRSRKSKELGESFVPSASAGEFNGALTDLQGFFDQIKTNLATLETKPNFHPIERINPYIGQPNAIIPDTLANKKEHSTHYYAKPAGTAAFLHAVRNYRPSQKIRALVSMHPEAYRGSNFHDPNFLWTGLGK